MAHTAHRLLWYVALADLSRASAADTVHSREDTAGLRRCGWDARLFARAPRSYRPAPHEVVVAATGGGGAGGLLSRLRYEALMIVRLLAAHPRPALLFFRGPSMLLALAVVARLLRVPFAVELNGVFPYRYGQRRATTWLERASDRFFLVHAALIVPVTRELAAQAEREKGSATLVAVAPNGVNPEVFRPARSVRRGSRLSLGFLGALYPFRGLLTAVRAVAELVGRGVDAELVVVGDGPLRGDIERTAEALGVADRVRLTGAAPPEEVGERLAGCDVALALFERCERLALTGASPLKVWTYLAIGKPVVLLDPGCMGHYASIPGILWLTDDNPARIADAIADWWAARGRDGLAALGRAGRRHVVENATWAQHARIISRALHRAIA